MSAVAVAPSPNESTGKSFFRMLIEKKWASERGKDEGEVEVVLAGELGGLEWKGAVGKIHGRSCTRG